MRSQDSVSTNMLDVMSNLRFLLVDHIFVQV